MSSVHSDQLGNTISARLILWRQGSGLDQLDVAAAVGCGLHYYQRFETGQALLDIDTLTGLARLGCNAG